MSEKRFIVESVSIIKDCNEDKSRIAKVITDKEELYSYNDLYEISDLLNELSTENQQLKEECDALQKKTEMDKNDFFISEAKRMRLLAFIEDNGLRKEYYEWERRIWNK